MISLVLYGRNDNYGYNLHKRAALSLNCMAEVLTGQDDEILFVDYNTPNDFPTFPEAIQDTLTASAKAKLRILRVRPEVHRRLFAHKTHLIALEPISRNAAVRRSNPNNRWILSSNTDMIFVPREGRSLTDAVAGLPDGFYCAPRLEIPETLWEDQFDRTDPARIIELTREWGWRYHLNEVVYGAERIRYDNPGDFQLILREDMFRYRGFHEEMVQGWHVDSNISKRLCFVHGAVGDAAPYVYGYHCDHTRQITPTHRSDAIENSVKLFVDDVVIPEIPEQAETWGLAHEEIEEVNLSTRSQSGYLKALDMAIPQQLSEPLESYYRQGYFNKNSADVGHILPFLVDLFVNYRRGAVIAWVGAHDETYHGLSAALTALGLGHELVSFDAETLSTADMFILNFGTPHAVEGQGFDEIKRVAFDIFAAEQVSLEGGRSHRRIVGINAVFNHAEQLMLTVAECARTPFSCRLRHGYIKDRRFLPKTIQATKRMFVTAHGTISEDGRAQTLPQNQIRADTPVDSIYGPYLTLEPGNFRAELTLSSSASGEALVKDAEAGRFLRVTYMLGENKLCSSVVSPTELRSKRIILDFAVSNNEAFGKHFEIVIGASLSVPVYVDDVSITRLENGSALSFSESPKQSVELLGMLMLSDGTERQLGGDLLVSPNVLDPGGARDSFYGPYMSLDAGDYSAELKFSFENNKLPSKWLMRTLLRDNIHLAVMCNGELLAKKEADGDNKSLTVRFDIGPDQEWSPVEFVLTSSLRNSLVVRSLRLTRTSA